MTFPGGNGVLVVVTNDQDVTFTFITQDKEHIKDVQHQALRINSEKSVGV